MRRILLAAFCLAAVAALIPAVSSARTHYSVKVTIRYGADSFLRGKVSSDKGRCFKHAKVVARLKTGDIVGTAFADRKGKWKLYAPGLVALVHAEVGRTGTSLESGVSFVCDRAESQDIAPVDV